MRDQIEETNRVARAVGGTLYTREVYSYTCKECGDDHVTKEGAPEICYRNFE